MKTYNIRGAIATRAAQIAAGAVKQKFRDEGGRNQDFRISDHRSAIDELAVSEEIVARATRDVELWFGAKIKHLHKSGAAEIASEFLCRNRERNGRRKWRP